MTSPVLSVTNIKKRFGDLEVLHGLSLEAHSGDVISLIGSSGSGKSTFLRCINLLEMPEHGEISLAGDAIKFKSDRNGGRIASDPQQVQHLRTRIGMVFQQFNLWSHMTILQNVMEAPVRVQGLPKAEAKEIALEFLDKVGVADKRDAYPAFLSGGQQQRVAIARALATQPRVLLMDEPFGALDAQTRARMQYYLMEIWKNIDITILFITHDLDEAILLADRILVLKANPGEVQELIEVPVPRPRHSGQLLEPEFLATKQRLEELIHPPSEHDENTLNMIRMVNIKDNVEPLS